MNITSNSHEHSLSIGNLDICAMRGSTPELVLAFNDQYGEPIQEIVLTAEYAHALRAHLNSIHVQQIFHK